MKIGISLFWLFGTFIIALVHGKHHGSGGYGSGGYGSGGYGSGGYGSKGYGSSSFGVIQSSYGGHVVGDKGDSDQDSIDEATVSKHEEDQVKWQSEHQGVVNVEHKISKNSRFGYGMDDKYYDKDTRGINKGSKDEGVVTTVYKIHKEYDFGTNHRDSEEHSTVRDEDKIDRRRESETSVQDYDPARREGFGIHHMYDSGTGVVQQEQDQITEEQWRTIIFQCWKNIPECPHKANMTQLCTHIASIGEWPECISRDEISDKGIFHRLGIHLWTGLKSIPHYAAEGARSLLG